jgi:hypothetical protein
VAGVLVSRALLLEMVAMTALTGACRNFGGPPPPLLAVSPPALAFTDVAGGVGPPLQALTVDAIGVGGGQLRWTSSADVSWITVTPPSDTAPAVAWVGAVVTGLNPGKYTGQLTISATSGPAQGATVPVTLTVVPAVSLAGRWAGATPTVALSFVISTTDTVVSGSGTLNPPLTPVAVTGVYRAPNVSLRLTAPDMTVTTFTGSLVNENAIAGVLNGGGLAGFAITVFRQ